LSKRRQALDHDFRHRRLAILALSPRCVVWDLAEVEAG
jgi:hypothetical protein